MKYLVTVLILFLSINTFSQDYKFGKVSKEELLEKRNPNDSSAHATVLYQNQEIYYQFSQNDGFVKVNYVHKRIKIYDKEGYDWATQKVRLYDKSAANSENLKGLKAFTYHLDNDKIKKTKLQSESIFDEKVNEFWAIRKFTMPNINDGVVVEFEYEIHSPYISIDDVILQELIPIRKLDFELRIPEYFNFNKTINPKSTYYPEIVESEYDRVENTYHRNRVTTNRGTQSSTTEASGWRFREKKYEIHESNIPALEQEPFVDNLRNYQAKIAWEYAFYKGPDGEIKTYSTTWEKVVETIYNNDSFGGQLNKGAYFKEEIDAILEGVDDPIQKAALVFDFVKSKVKWNGFVSIYTNEGVKNAYKKGEGNVAEINLMLTAMLRYAGLTSNPVLVSTRDNGIPFLPTREGFNYVICAIEVQDSIILLDATHPYSTANILPEHVINWQGRIVREHGSSSWISLNSSVASKETVSLNMKVNDDLSIEGKVRGHLTNYLAYEFREKYNNLSPELQIQNFEKDKNGIEIVDLEMDGNKSLSEPITYSYQYQIDNMVEEIGGKLYITPLSFLAPEDNPFKVETRQYPIDIIFPRSEKYVVNMMLPNGYVVESLPSNLKVQFNNGESEFTYLAKENGDFIQFTMSLEMSKTLILPKDYREFKKFFELMIEKEIEKVVLKKV